MREKRYKWTPSEDEILRVSYRRALPLKEIAQRLGRTWKTCGTRAKRLGLSHPNGTRNSNKVFARWTIADPLHNPELPHLPYVPGIIVTGRYLMVNP
jgi:hypothetical protein